MEVVPSTAEAILGLDVMTLAWTNWTSFAPPENDHNCYESLEMRTSPGNAVTHRRLRVFTLFLGEEKVQPTTPGLFDADRLLVQPLSEDKLLKVPKEDGKERHCLSREGSGTHKPKAESYRNVLRVGARCRSCTVDCHVSCEAIRQRTDRRAMIMAEGWMDGGGAGEVATKEEAGGEIEGKDEGNEAQRQQQQHHHHHHRKQKHALDFERDFDPTAVEKLKLEEELKVVA